MSNWLALASKMLEEEAKSRADTLVDASEQTDAETSGEEAEKIINDTPDAPDEAEMPHVDEVNTTDKEGE